MWAPDSSAAFERDGHLALEEAFGVDDAARMSEAIWRYVESRSDIRRGDRSTWPRGAPVGFSFKKLKRHTAFRAVVESERTRCALDAIFGRGGWAPNRNGAQILLSFPDTTPDEWTVPSRLWHMDGPFARRVSPPRMIKLFSVVEPLRPRGGATLVLAGTPNLQAAYAHDAPEEHRAGGRTNWDRFLRTTDPWLARFARPEDSPDRNVALAEPRVVDGQPVELRELGGAPGDVHVCNINLFHSDSPNAGDVPRVMVTHVVQPAVDEVSGISG